jgi:hypothetical protein
MIVIAVLEGLNITTLGHILSAVVVVTASNTVKLFFSDPVVTIVTSFSPSQTFVRQYMPETIPSSAANQKEGVGRQKCGIVTRIRLSS